MAIRFFALYLAVGALGMSGVLSNLHAVEPVGGKPSPANLSKDPAASNGASSVAPTGLWGPLGFHATWVTSDQRPATPRPKALGKRPDSRKTPPR